MFFRLLENYQKLLMELMNILWLIWDQVNPPQLLRVNQISSRGPLSLCQNEYANDSDTSVAHDRAGVLDVSLVHDLLEQGGIALVRFSRDGRYLATARDIYGHNKASIHDVKTGALINVLEVFFTPTEKRREARITDICFSPDSLCLATGEQDGTIRIWDILKKHVRSVFRNEEDLYSLDFSLNGKLLISGSAHGTVHVWNVRDGSSNTLYCDLRHLRSVCFSADGLHVAAGGLDGIRMWELGLDEPLQGFDSGQRQWVHSLVFTPMGLISGIYDKTIIHWDIGVLGEYETVETEDPTNLAPDGMGPRKEIQIPSQTFKGYQSGPYTVAFVLISIPLRSGIHSVSISQNGRWVLSGSKSSTVCIWDVHKAELHCELSRERKDDVVSVDFSPTGGYIATAYGDGGVRIWHYEESRMDLLECYYQQESETGLPPLVSASTTQVILVHHKPSSEEPMAPRGLSAEDKRVKLLEIFQETKDFYQLKELEKLGPKMKGIVSQSVKEVLQGLVDDGLVQAEKIGASNFFWSFPSQQGVVVQSKVNAAKESQKVHRDQIAELKCAIESAKAERHVSDTRSERLENLTQLKKELASLESEINAYGDSNPTKVEEAKRAAFLAKEASYRWTDNYSVLLSHFIRQNGVNAEDIRQYLGIGEAYEDLD